MLNTFSSAILLLMCTSSMAYAQLVPIDEHELSNTTGQAFINVDHTSGDSLDFTKVTLGLDVKTSLNADLLELGNYTRDGVAGSDIKINDFALGKVDSSGNIIPFEIKDPFIELAFDKSSGQQNLVGVRLGFGGAKGALSGNIESLTGNVNVDIKDTAQALNFAGEDANLIGRVLSALGPTLLGNSPLNAQAVLVDDAGDRNAIRSTQVGIENGKEFEIDASGVGNFSRGLLGVTFALLPNASCTNGCRDITLISQGCELVGGISSCFSLSDYKTLEVGNKQSDGSFDFAEGLSLSFQSQQIVWQGTGGVVAEKGAFLNVPNGGLEVTLQEALVGTARVRTKYVDPYF